MYPVGTKVIAASSGTPGEIVQHVDGYLTIKWDPGYDSHISGWELGCPAHWIDEGRILVEEKPTEEAAVPEPMKVSTPFDPFQKAFQLQFEV